ncbi:DNA topoisomerase subunit B [Stomatohabitans albus]|uniref:DNA topoisomerase subunit B n=1 Tax=Stomatohabitans albus TaxID=3110766 RepID=UPI00300D1B2F
MSSQDYGADQITALEGLEAVRVRPGMYIGDTGVRGLHHLIWEIVDNSVDEAMAGYCDHIVVTLRSDGGVRVDDNGRGIPVARHSTGRSALELVLTELHAGGKFDSQAYKVSGGLHGVGVSVVNALSTRLIAEVRRDEHVWQQEYIGSEPQSPPTAIADLGKDDETGTSITFWPDPKIFETVTLEWDRIETRIRDTAFLKAGLRIELIDEREPLEDGSYRRVVHEYSDGLADFVTHLAAHKGDPLHGEVIRFAAMEDQEDTGYADLDIAMQWNPDYAESIFSFANTIATGDGGTHEDGFKAALTNVVNRVAKDMGVLPTKGKDAVESLEASDIREGLTAVISVNLAEPQFEGQTKGKLGNTHIRSFVQKNTFEQLKIWFTEHPAEAKAIFEKAIQAARGRRAARAARDATRRKGLLDSTSLPGKLADCQSKNAEECELFIVEGDSAGGTSKMARDRRIQAILPLRGKILNVEKAAAHRIFESDTIKSLINAIGTGVGDEFDIEKARYHKIVMLMDADVDGAHIRTLVLTFLFRHMRELIRAGFVYIAQPPLYQIQPKGAKGKERIRYALNEEERDQILEEMAAAGVTKPEVGRLKGLGEMDDHQLEVTTMNPKTRHMLQVTMEDAASADLMFRILMGDDVDARREFIIENANNVQFLDV